MNTNSKLPVWFRPVRSAAFPNRIQLLLFVALGVFVTALTPRSVEAVVYYYDNDPAAGFGTAGGTWAAPTPGPIPGWTTDGTGVATPGSVTTLITDTLNFGNGATGLGAGTITLSGALSSGSMTFAAGSGPISLSVGTSLTLSASPTITVDNSSDTIATPLAGAGTTLTKAGNGTLILSGTNTVNGAVTITGGQLQLNGGSLNLGAKALTLTSATSTGQTAVFSLVNGNFTNGTSDAIGAGTNAVGVIKMSGGTYIKTNGNLNLAGGVAGRTNYAAFLMSGGTTAIGTEFDMARDSSTASTYVGLSGGTFSCSNFATVGREGLGVLDISGGTFLRPFAAINKFYMNRSAGSFSQLTVRGTGVIDFEDPNGFPFANSTANIGTGVVNLLPGGTLIDRVGISWNANASAVGHFNFNGGTLQASGSSATFWTGLWSACYIYSGGGTIDSQANNITIAQPLLMPAGNGVSSITGGTGSGYLAPPVVSITGDGTGATAIAQIDSNGNITNVLVSNPGVNYSTATVTLVGGGGTGSGWTANLSANATTGGLTKLGSGTLTLSGANSYQGPTKVGGGTLAISAGNYPNVSALTLSNGTAANFDVSGGASTLKAPSVNLGANTTLSLNYGALAGNPFQPAISDATINAGTALTANGTNIVINLAGSGFTSGQFPLIKYSGSIGGNGFAAFKLGTLPSGVPASSQLVNNTGSKTIDLSIPLVNTLTWNGTNSNWDINTTLNWKDSLSNPSTYKQYGTTNIYGDIVTFDDSLSNPSLTNINLTTTLSPTTVNVSASGNTYAFGGAGKLSGGAFLNVNGFGTFTINTANDNTGGSSLSAGTVLVGNNAALGTGPITLAGSVLSSDSATPRTLSNALTLNVDSTFGTGASSGALTFTGPVDLGNPARGLTSDNNVAFTGPTTDGGINKAGIGTLTVDNPATLLTGVTTVNAGKVTLNNGTFSGAFNIAPGIFQTGVIEIGNANITNSAQNNVATSANTIGVIKQSGGSFVETGTMAFGSVNSGASAAYLMSGGFASFGGDTRLDNNGAVGLISQTGGNMVSLNFFTIARDGGLGVYDLSGGTHLRPANAINQFYLGTRADGGNAQVTIRGSGTMDIEDSDGLWFDRAGDRTLQGVGMVNLLTGGTLISRVGLQWGSSNIASVGYVNFNGGTLRASGSSSSYWSGWSGAYAFSGGATIDTQGFNIGIGQALLAPTGGGVTSITGGSGSGYLSPPVVSISGDGTGATAVSQIDASGNITGILVTSPGVNYTSASVNLSGGGGSGGGYNATIGANATTGGLTKLGSGTLTLSGTNTYSGTTLVNNGTFVLGTAHAGTGNVTVANNATFGCLSGIPGATVHVASATLGATGSGLLAQFTGNTGNPTTVAGFITNLTLNGPTAVSVLCNGAQVGTIPLFQYSTLGGAGSITTGTLPQGVVGTITNNTSTKTISLVISGFAPLVWSGANSSLWDINTSTNWILSAAPATYQDGASVCLFNDTAVNTNVLITQPVSPGSVVFSNNTVAYTVSTSGSGILTGGTGLTKNGSGTVTFSSTNSYTGATVINAGTLQLGDGSASGTLADATAITVGANGTLTYNDALTLNGIINNISGTGTINKNGAQMGWGGTNTFSGTINIIGNKLAFSGADSADGQPNVNIASGCVLSIGSGFAGGTAAIGNLAGAGSVDVAFGATTGTRTMQVNQTTNGVFSGQMTDSSAGRVLALTKTGPAVLTLSGTNQFSGPVTVNNGTLVVNGVMVSNSIVTVNSGATFGGSGTVASTVSFAGSSSATTTVGTPLTVSTLDMAGNATMKVTTTSPVAAGTYPLINYSSLTSGGQFSGLVVGGSGLVPGASASISTNSGVISLNVVGGGPAPTNILFSHSGNQLILNWPAGQGWQLQVQTNTLNPSNWFTISNAIPPFTNTIPPVNQAVFYRLKF